MMKILFELNNMDKRYSVAFMLLIKMNSEEVFDFLRESKYECKMDDYFYKLIRLNPRKALSYAMFRFKIHTRTAVIAECVKILIL